MNPLPSTRVDWVRPAIRQKTAGLRNVLLKTVGLTELPKTAITLPVDERRASIVAQAAGTKRVERDRPPFTVMGSHLPQTKAERDQAEHDILARGFGDPVEPHFPMSPPPPDGPRKSLPKRVAAGARKLPHGVITKATETLLRPITAFDAHINVPEPTILDHPGLRSMRELSSRELARALAERMRLGDTKAGRLALALAGFPEGIHKLEVELRRKWHEWRLKKNEAKHDALENSKELELSQDIRDMLDEYLQAPPGSKPTARAMMNYTNAHFPADVDYRNKLVGEFELQRRMAEAQKDPVAALERSIRVYTNKAGSIDQKLLRLEGHAVSHQGRVGRLKDASEKINKQIAAP